MPRRIDDDDEKPRRRRRSAKAAAIEAEEERGLMMRIFLHSPKDVVAGLIAATAICAIITNALFLQAGRHPSPMFGSIVTLPAPQAAVASPLPRPRPVVEADPQDTRQVEARGTDARQADSRNADARNADALTSLVVKSTSAPATTPANVARPPAPIPATAQSAGARRVAAVQRTLTQYGYGQLKATGAIGSDTQAAIAKFERERKLPVTGQMSDRLVRELSAMVGHPIE
ncbi:MAG TPA: peptidoglycan-binding protein [Bradyrhizobium sp.]